MSNEKQLESNHQEMGDFALCHLMMGQYQMASAFGKLATVASLKSLQLIKNKKLYKKLTPKRGQVASFTWQTFCESLGASRRHIDEQLQNLEAFGGEALECMQQAGIQYRDLRRLRAIPEQTLEAFTEQVVNTDDKSEILDLVENLVLQKEDAVRQKTDVDHALAQAEARLRIQQNRADALRQRVEHLENPASHPWPHDVRRVREESMALGALVLDGMQRLSALIGDLAGDDFHLSNGPDGEEEFSAAASALYLNLYNAYVQSVVCVNRFGEKIGKQHMSVALENLPAMTDEESRRCHERIETVLGSALGDAANRHSKREKSAAK